MKEDFEAGLYRTIATYVYAVLGVFDDKGTDDNVLYTVGFALMEVRDYLRSQ